MASFVSGPALACLLFVGALFLISTGALVVAQQPATQPAKKAKNAAAPTVKTHRNSGKSKGARAQREADIKEAMAELETARPPMTPAAEEYFRGKLAEAQVFFNHRHYKRAFELTEAIVALAPDLSFLKKVRSLRRQAEGRYLSGSIIMVTFEEVGTQGFPRQSVKGELVFENISFEPVTIGWGGKSSVIGQATYEVVETYEDGSTWTTVGTKNIRLPEGIPLDPNEKKRMPIEIKIPRGTGHPQVQFITVQGKLIANEVMITHDRVGRSIPWVESRLMAVTSELVAATKQPREQLQVAVLMGDARRALVAATVWLHQLDEQDVFGDGVLKDQGRFELIRVLAAGLEDAEPKLELVLTSMLERTTGLTFNGPKKWQEWYLDPAPTEADKSTHEKSRSETRDE